VEQTRTWVQWFQANNGAQAITDGTSYVVKSVFNGQLLNSAELAAVHAQSGISVIEWAAAVALFADENWTEV